MSDKYFDLHLNGLVLIPSFSGLWLVSIYDRIQSILSVLIPSFSGLWLVSGRCQGGRNDQS